MPTFSGVSAIELPDQTQELPGARGGRPAWCPPQKPGREGVEKRAEKIAESLYRSSRWLPVVPVDLSGLDHHLDGVPVFELGFESLGCLIEGESVGDQGFGGGLA